MILSKLFCKSVLSYNKKYGNESRGSYILVDDKNSKINIKKVRIQKKQEEYKLSVCLKNKMIKTKLKKVNPIPENRELWFEKVWSAGIKIFL